MISPKQPPLVTKRDWYPYYAGFTERFAEAVLSKHLADSISVLDPWNGSGTTTLVCARHGISSTGLDVNPALTVIARARLTPRSRHDSLLKLGNKLLTAARDLDAQVKPDDPLGRWMTRDAIRSVRAVQNAIHLLAGTETVPPKPGSVASMVDNLPVPVCFFYSALFATVRDLLSEFRPTNPMWLKYPQANDNKTGAPWHDLATRFAESVIFLQQRLKLDHDGDHARLATFQTTTANSIGSPAGHFGGALTSPPYATRVDYVMGTLPELAVLEVSPQSLCELRKATTGSPVVAGARAGGDGRPILSDCARRLLVDISNHKSKGSRRYYLPWMYNYMVGLQEGLSELSRTVHREAPICIVVQDSFYKELRVPLQRVVIETLGQSGRSIVDRHDFEVRTLRSRMNPRSSRHLTTRTNTESLLVFS